MDRGNYIFLIVATIVFLVLFGFKLDIFSVGHSFFNRDIVDDLSTDSINYIFVDDTLYLPEPYIGAFSDYSINKLDNSSFQVLSDAGELIFHTSGNINPKVVVHKMVEDTRGFIIELEFEDEMLGVASSENIYSKAKDDMMSLMSYSNQITGNAIASSMNIKEYHIAINAVAANISEDVAKEMEKKDYVKAVHEDKNVKVFLNNSIPLVKAPQVWDRLDSNGINLTGKNVSIAIIDTGVDYTHSDLGGCFDGNCRVKGGYDFSNNDADPMDDHGHGTHVAATAAGNGILKGVAPDASIYAYKVLNKDGSGAFSTVISGIEKAMDPNGDGDTSDHLDIISLSLGSSGDPDDPVSKAIDAAVDAGIIAVVAAGNSGESGVNSPGTARKALTVAATDKDDVLATFSSRGPVDWNLSTILKPDVSAPGVDICAAQWQDAWTESECIDNQHTAISGTSMATPHVAGLSALIKQLHPDLSSLQIKHLIMMTADPLNCTINECGTGRINAVRATSSELTYNNYNTIHFDLNDNITSQKLALVNLQDHQVSIKLEFPNMQDEFASNYSSILSTPTNDYILNPGVNYLDFKLSTFDVNGFYTGKIIIKTQKFQYSVPYMITNFAFLHLSMPNHFPSYLIYNNNFFRKNKPDKKVVLQQFDYDGDKITLRLNPGNYSIFAHNYFRTNIAQEDSLFIISDMIEINEAKGYFKTFSLDEATKIPFETFGGDKVNLNGFSQGLRIYNNTCAKYCPSYSSSELACLAHNRINDCYWAGTYCESKCFKFEMHGGFGDGEKAIYVNSAPLNGLNNDLIIGYNAIPEKITLGGGSAIIY